MDPFSKSWDHTLRIRDIFVGASDLPAAHETIAMGRMVVGRIKTLQGGLKADDPLLHDLDLVVENFDDLDAAENAYEARDLFNQCLGLLYDEADHGKRVWIE